MDKYIINGLLKYLNVSPYDADYYVLSGYKYDIRKTDSVVTPYTATVSFSGIHYIRTGATLQECKDAGWGMGSNFEEALFQTYAYQDGKWILKELFIKDVKEITEAAIENQKRISAEIDKLPVMRRVNKAHEMFGKDMQKLKRSISLLMRQMESWHME